MRRSTCRPARSVGKRFGDTAKRGITWILDAFGVRSDERPPPPPDAIDRILLVRPNFRLGNAILVTSLLPVIHARFPGATVDVLATDSTAAVFAGLGIDQIHRLSRTFTWAPWRFLRLFLRLRRRCYDAAIDGGMSSFSGAFYAWLCGATWRIGSRGRSDRLLNVRLNLPTCECVYDAPHQIAKALGVSSQGWPSHRVAPLDASAAAAEISRWQKERALELSAPVGVFVGGHAHKRWPRESWIRLLQHLDADRVPTLVFLGPEESAFAPALRSLPWSSVRIVSPRPLRNFAALVARCHILVTPDSGPMHLAAALGVPALALLTTERSRFYVPPHPTSLVLMNPRPEDVIRVLRGMHPSLTQVRGARADRWTHPPSPVALAQ